MTSGPEPVGTLEVALAHAEKLLLSQPGLAAEQAREILGAVPNHPAATLLLAMARRRSNEVADALRILEPLAASQPRWAVAQRELGLALGDAGRGDEAVAALRRAVRLQPTMADAMYAPVCTRFVTYDTELDDRCARYRDVVMSSRPMKEWVAAAEAEPEDLDELDVEF